MVDVFSQAKPNFIIGFDMDGLEDGGDALHKFANELTELPPTAHYFFHAGASSKYKDRHRSYEYRLNVRNSNGFIGSESIKLSEISSNSGKLLNYLLGKPYPHCDKPLLLKIGTVRMTGI